MEDVVLSRSDDDVIPRLLGNLDDLAVRQDGPPHDLSHDDHHKVATLHPSV